MKIVLDSGGNVVKLLRGDGINRGQHRSKPIEVEWEKGQAPYELGVIDKENLVVQVCITRPDGEQSGWQTMFHKDGTNEKRTYVYPLQGWDTAVSGEAIVSVQWYDYTLTDNIEELTINLVDEIRFIIANGVIAQPVQISSETYNIFVHEMLKTLATKAELNKFEEKIYKLNIEGGEGAGSVQQRTYEQDSEFNPKAKGLGSSAFGTGTVANNENESSFGSFNKSSEKTLLSVGNGTDEENRKNAFEVLADGRAKVQSAAEEDDDVIRYIELKEYTKKQWDDFNLSNGEGEFSVVMADGENTATQDKSTTLGSRNKNYGRKCFMNGTGNLIEVIEGETPPNSCDVNGQENILRGYNMCVSVRGKKHVIDSGCHNSDVSGESNTLRKATNTKVSGIWNTAKNTSKSSINGTYNTIDGFSKVHIIGNRNVATSDNQILLGDWVNAVENTLLALGVGYGSARKYNAIEVQKDGRFIVKTAKSYTDTGGPIFSKAFEVLTDGRVKGYGTPKEPEDLIPKWYIDKFFGSVTPEILQKLETVAAWFEEDSSGTSTLFKNVEDNTTAIKTLENTVADIATDEEIIALFA